MKVGIHDHLQLKQLMLKLVNDSMIKFADPFDVCMCSTRQITDGTRWASCHGAKVVTEMESTASTLMCTG